MISVLSVLVVLFCVSSCAYFYHGVVEKMEMEEIVPDVLQVPPRDLLEVKFEEVTAHIGNELTPSQTRKAPFINWIKKPRSFHTVCMTDADSPSRDNPSNREYLHWLVVNIPANKVSAGETLSEYIGPGPRQGTGLHRYVLLVYKQPKKLKFEEPYLNGNSSRRMNFSVVKFAEKYNLSNPVAGNFYEAQWDRNVPPLS